MRELKATPPPWNKSYLVEQPNDQKRPMVSWGGITIAITHPSAACPRDQCEANAHLIAAAPELYEALRILKASYESLAYDYQYAVGAGDIHPIHAEYIQRSVDVLAKARGES